MDGAPTSVWRPATAAHGGVVSVQVVPYGDLGGTSLISPAIQNPGGTLFVSWWNRRGTEPGFDFLAVEWSTMVKRCLRPASSAG